MFKRNCFGGGVIAVSFAGLEEEGGLGTRAAKRAWVSNCQAGSC